MASSKDWKILQFGRNYYLKSTEVARGAGLEPYPAARVGSKGAAEETPLNTSSFSAARPC